MEIGDVNDIKMRFKSFMCLFRATRDLQLINAYINNNAKNSVLLRLRFWFNLAIHFVSRGLEFHHQLNLNSFDFHIGHETTVGAFS
jgi:hypothetical protein